MVLAVMEGVVMCFVLLIICVVGIANGPEGMVFFYEKEVQDKAIELGLTTRETIKKRLGRGYFSKGNLRQRIQRTYVGKVAELAFAQRLLCGGKVKCQRCRSEK